MAASFFFYDLETSGFNPRTARIMQFAGQRTDLNLKPIDEPVNLFIKITDDILPDADAVLTTGITPQMTAADGLTEAEFLREFASTIATPDTIFVGYNSVRFDDEFMRCLHYRNFYDPYQWQWQDGRSRWDLLDVVRMTRALRPEGIEWPFDIHGKPTNRLELLTGMNKLAHEQAHDAASDVAATIEVARLIRGKHTKLFEYLLTMRDKNKVAELVNKSEPFIYTSGKYSSEYQKTTASVKICDHPKRQGALVYNLRYDPAKYANSTPEQLAEAWKWEKDKGEEDRLPVKALSYNRCPAVAPLGVLDDASKERLGIDLKTVEKHLAALKDARDLPDRLCRALELMDKQQQTRLVSTDKDVDELIYDGFFGRADQNAMSVVRAAEPSELGDLGLKFEDHRLEALLPLYKARNFPKHLSAEERSEWENFRTRKLLAGGDRSKMAKYFSRLQEILGQGDLTGHQEYLIEELRLWAENIAPETD
jgi:exodeoxyribonuclease-1